MATREECLAYVLQRRFSKTLLVSVLIALIPLQYLKGSSTGILAAGIVFAVGMLSHFVAVDLGKRIETSLTGRKVVLIVGTALAVALLGLMVGFVETIPTPALIVLAATTIALMNGTNSFITASRFNRLTDKDLLELEERPLRLHHPLW